ncbi:MAG TPA: hypothetical protein VN326_19320 [Casimicrobiaceae bacterium]|jgi:hypothetical protein|nr:hypothetical protein [Casimicrobiaceae bacterium]
MKTMKDAAAFLVSVMTLVLLMVSSAQAGPSCQKIDATGVGQDQGSGVTTAQISDGGLLQGTTAAAFTGICRSCCEHGRGTMNNANRLRIRSILACAITTLRGSAASIWGRVWT